jgi:PTH1 family peptidyl-tRNA hydrolase
MKLIIGLGNPDAQYDGTRHNFGFAAVERAAAQCGARWRNRPKFQAAVAAAEIGGEKVLFAKPQTFYNLSGQAAQQIKRFYDLSNADILAIYDEMALPLGVARTRRGGADAGNNGVKSLIQHIGNDFARLRIGSGAAGSANGDTRPAISQHTDHVLSRPTAAEMATLDQLAPKIDELIQKFIAGDFQPHSVKV